MTDLAQLLPVLKAKFSGEEQLCVNMRNVHAALGVGRMYAHWIQERIAKYDFIEHEDYEKFATQLEQNSTADVLANFGKCANQGLSQPYAQGGEHGPVRIDYYFTLDAAKEIAMVENNERGREIRKYFIACEKQLRKTTPPQTYLESLKAFVAEVEAREKAQAALAEEKQKHAQTIMELHDVQWDRDKAVTCCDTLEKRLDVAYDAGDAEDMRSAYEMEFSLCRFFDTGKRIGSYGFYYYMSGFAVTFCRGGMRSNMPPLPDGLYGYLFPYTKRYSAMSGSTVTVFPKAAWTVMLTWFAQHEDQLSSLPGIGGFVRKQRKS